MDELRGPSALIQGGKPSSITKACKNVLIAPKRGIVEKIFFTRDEVHVDDDDHKDHFRVVTLRNIASV